MPAWRVALRGVVVQSPTKPDRRSGCRIKTKGVFRHAMRATTVRLEDELAHALIDAYQ
ncbi:hypothetical protein Mal64_37700 [Pseudobythopirellula maris]|uniref:Uncharacterized protein n=1 Tax=Pseudobythopirellula maris TaxID=2527991 RepID=A0A5C5ZIG8_9BACT|nr:hypothetical protein [Pseudobythopirellula maris]TWT86940.1 hypothetical protein Mal64_37700 [Pseudobythopirellula maris]